MTTLLPSALVYKMWSEKQFVDTAVALGGGRAGAHSSQTHQAAAGAKVNQPPSPPELVGADDGAVIGSGDFVSERHVAMVVICGL